MSGSEAGSIRRTRRLPTDPARLFAQAFAVIGLLIMTEAPISFIMKTGLAPALGPLINLQWLLVFATGLIGLASLAGRAGQAVRDRGRELGVVIGGVGLVWLICLNFYLTMLWSYDPAHTFRIASFYLGTVLFGAWLGAHCRSWVELARLIAVTSFCLGMVSTLLALAPGSVGVMKEIHPGAWSGLWDEKNRFGTMLAVGLVCTVACWFARPSVGWVLVALFLAFCIVMARSSTALLAGVCGSAVVVLIHVWSGRPGLGLGLAYLGVCCLTGIIGFALFAPDQFAELLGRDPTFTSRTDIWTLATAAIAERPVSGWGYGAFWRIDPSPGDELRQVLGFKVMNSHQSWLDMWLEAGVAGLVLAALAVVALAVHLLRAGLLVRHAGAGLGLLVLMMVYSFSETVLFQANGYLSMLFVALASRSALSLFHVRDRDMRRDASLRRLA